MKAYIIRRLLLIIPTLMGIILLNFLIVQAAPGGPVEQLVAELTGKAADASARVGGGGQEVGGANAGRVSENSKYRGAQGLDPEIIKRIEKAYGFDKPAYERFFIMLGDYLRFDFGQSLFQDKKVVELVLEKMPVSISLGLWTTLIIYAVSIPLGIRKAVRDGSSFDVWSSVAIVIAYSIPAFMFAVLLVVLFAGGSFWSLFPLRGVVSDNWAELGAWGKIKDYAWHMALPVTAMTIGGFASLTMLTKNSFLDEIGRQYVLTARAKGLSERKVLYGHVFRNAMLIVIAGFPGLLLRIFFTGSLLIEVIFSLDGLGLLGFQAAINRDYPVMFGTLYIFTLIGLLVNLASDVTYALVDPRIDFTARSQ